MAYECQLKEGFYQGYYYFQTVQEWRYFARYNQTFTRIEFFFINKSSRAIFRMNGVSGFVSDGQFPIDDFITDDNMSSFFIANGDIFLNENRKILIPNKYGRYRVTEHLEFLLKIDTVPDKYKSGLFNIFVKFTVT